MTFPELGKLDFPDDQVTGLTIAFKTDVNAGYTKTLSPGEYLAEIVVRRMQDFAAQHVSGEQLDRIFTALKLAFERQDVAEINAVAVDLHVDITIDPNAAAGVIK